MVSSEMAENSPSPHQEAPSPQCVGREFVRQYYTLLAEAPRFVYRFYSNESIFVHGSDEEIVGQTAIEKKISELGFHDCRTRIRVLDSHETIGKGVVVQVVGEITVNGDMNAMRRFVQTFVLAPQSEKKYYVYNDIFRYEDDLFKESDGKDKDGENDSGTVPDPPSARPLEQHPPRGMSNGGTHGGTDDLDAYYSMLPGQTQPQPQQSAPAFQPSMTSEQGIQSQRVNSPSTQPTSGYGVQAPLPQRTAPAAAPETLPATYQSDAASGAWSGSPNQLPQSTSSVGFVVTGPPAADAHQHQYAQPSQQPQQQQTSAASLNAAMPSQSPVPSSSVAPQAPTSAPPNQSRPQSAGKESPGLTNEQDQPRDTAMAPPTNATWAHVLVKKTNKGPQPPANISASGQQQVSPGQNAQHRPPIDGPMPAGTHRWPAVPPSHPQQQQQQQYGQNYPTPWEVPQQQYNSRQYRQSNTPEFVGGQSQDARASPAPSGGGGGSVRNIPAEEGAYLKNVPMDATEGALRHALSEANIGIRDVRLVRKEGVGVAYAFVHLDSIETADRLIGMGSFKMNEAQISAQPLRRQDSYMGGRGAPGTGPGPGMYGYGGPGGMVRGGGRGGGRGNMAQRGGERGGRGGRGGSGGRMFSAGGGNRGGGSFQNN